jgi:hypothetical protein
MRKTPRAKNTAPTVKNPSFGAMGESAGKTRVGIAQMSAETELAAAPRGNLVGRVTVFFPSPVCGQHMREA